MEKVESDLNRIDADLKTIKYIIDDNNSKLTTIGYTDSEILVQIKLLQESINFLTKQNSKVLDDVNNLRIEVKNLSHSCRRMDDHISFVNGVYATIRSPADFILCKVRRLMGSKVDETSLPQIKSDD